MSEELNKTEASMPFLTLEPQLEPEAPEQPENPAALMEETPDMDPVQKEMARMELTLSLIHIYLIVENYQTWPQIKNIPIAI